MDVRFRKLRPDEIDVRVGRVIGDKGVMLLLYKDARCDMAILDETVGPMNWKREHSRDNRNCTVSIWDDDKKQWVGKEDTGTESNTEAEKGLASDSFKRACVNWGIGRELYTAPEIVAWSNNGVKIERDSKGRNVCRQRFKVGAIDYSESGDINALSIKADNRQTVFSFGSSHPVSQQERSAPARRNRTWDELDRRMAEVAGAVGLDVATLDGMCRAAGCKTVTQAYEWIDTALEQGRIKPIKQ